jgi:hypothetical protein
VKEEALETLVLRVTKGNKELKDQEVPRVLLDQLDLMVHVDQKERRDLLVQVALTEMTVHKVTQDQQVLLGLQEKGARHPSSTLAKMTLTTWRR